VGEGEPGNTRVLASILSVRSIIRCNRSLIVMTKV
jgi:hypothetical protein